jgi:hypothetical protein
MNKRDCIAIGLKILGVYFAVIGVALLLGAFTSTALRIIDEIRALFSSAPTGVRPGSTSSSLAFLFQTWLHPIVYLSASFILAQRTSACLRLVAQNDTV